jgi:excinuclease UvrABC nuclease subunit
MTGEEIKYTITMHSDIISLDLLYDEYIVKGNRKEIKIIKSGLSGCYFLHDENKNIIYIGKAKNIRQRIISHIFSPVSKYIDKYEIDKIIEKRKKAKYFSYSEIDYRYVDFVEQGLINKYQPMLNIQFVNKL